MDKRYFIFSLPKDQTINRKVRYLAIAVKDLRPAKRVSNTLSMAIATAYENPVELFVIEDKPLE